MLFPSLERAFSFLLPLSLSLREGQNLLGGYTPLFFSSPPTGMPANVRMLGGLIVYVYTHTHVSERVRVYTRQGNDTSFANNAYPRAPIRKEGRGYIVEAIKITFMPSILPTSPPPRETPLVSPETNQPRMKGADCFVNNVLCWLPPPPPPTGDQLPPIIVFCSSLCVP